MDNLLIFYTLTFILLLTGGGMLSSRNKYGWVALGFGISLAGLFVTSWVCAAYFMGGLALIPIGIARWKKTE